MGNAFKNKEFIKIANRQIKIIISVLNALMNNN